MFYSFSLLCYLFQHMFHHLLYHTNRDQIMKVLPSLLYFVCAAMSSTASYVNSGTNIDKCEDGKEVSKLDCLTAAATLFNPILAYYDFYSNSYFPCGCFFSTYSNNAHVYFNDSHNGVIGCTASAYYTVICQDDLPLNHVDHVDLETAGNFAILTKSGVTTTGTTSVTGHMGTSPIAQTSLTGFALTLSLTDDHSTSSMVTGNVYAADHADPTPAMMTTAIYDMEAAYTDAAGRAGPGPVTDGLGLAGDISGLTLPSGIYKWSTDVKFDEDITFYGNAKAVWILQIAGTFTAGPSARVKLAGGALAENIFWAVADTIAFDDGSHGEGIFLGKTMISFNAGSSLNGAALAQTAVTMIATTIVKW